MIWLFFLLVAVLVAAGFAALITRRITFDPLPEPVHTAHDVLAARLRTAADIDDIHFDTALRGYRMDQVDDVLDALQTQLREYERGETPTTKLTRVPRPAAPLGAPAAPSPGPTLDPPA